MVKETSSQRYNLEVSESQVKLISLALDIYSRMEGGQLQWVFSMISWKHYENLKNVESLLNELQVLLTGMQKGNLGIGNVSNSARMAYDLHQIIRYRLALDDKQDCDNSLKPMQWSDEPFAKITPIIPEK